MKHPKDWEKLQLRDLGHIQMCRRIFQRQTSSKGQVPFYKIGTFGGKADAYISNDLYEKYIETYPYPEKGDVLLSAAGTIGKTVVFNGEKSYFQDSNIVWLKVDKKKIDRAFLKLFYQSFPWKNLEGTTINRLYNNIILSTEINLPPIAEQRAIAKIISNFDSHIDNLSVLIKKMKMIRDGALEDLVTGKTRLSGFNEEWKKVSFDEVITPKARIGWQGLKKDEYLKYGYSYLIGGINFENGKIKQDELFSVPQERYDLDPYIQVQENDVLVTKDGTVGKVARVPELDKPATLNSGVFVFRTSERLSKNFLFTVLISSVFKGFIDTLSAGSTIKHLYQKDLKKFSFDMPENVEEQEAIAVTIAKMDDEIEALETEKAKMMTIREGVMDDLLTGRVRLKI